MKNEDLEKQFAEFLQQENSQNEIKNAKIEILENDNSETTKSEKELEIDKPKSTKNFGEVNKTNKLQSENIKINFQISHIYIFGLIATSVIFLNIAVWSLAYFLLELFGFFVYLFVVLMANLKIPFPYFVYQDFLNSNFLRSFLSIFFVYCNYRLHTKFLKKIFGNLEI